MQNQSALFAAYKGAKSLCSLAPNSLPKYWRPAILVSTKKKGPTDRMWPCSCCRVWYNGILRFFVGKIRVLIRTYCVSRPVISLSRYRFAGTKKNDTPRYHRSRQTFPFIRVVPQRYPILPGSKSGSSFPHAIETVDIWPPLLQRFNLAGLRRLAHMTDSLVRSMPPRQHALGCSTVRRPSPARLAGAALS